MGHDSDELLMRQVRQGQRECLAPLVRRYASPLLTYIQRMIGDAHRGEELFQEVFLRVWKKRKQYKFPRPFRAWLFAIATNHCRADFRRPRPTVIGFDVADPEMAVAAGPTPVEAMISTETSHLVGVAVANLPDQQRSVVVLRVWNELSFAEIADAVGCVEATARSHMHHALTTIRNYLEPRMRNFE